MLMSTAAGMLPKKTKPSSMKMCGNCVSKIKKSQWKEEFQSHIFCFQSAPTFTAFILPILEFAKNKSNLHVPSSLYLWAAIVPSLGLLWNCCREMNRSLKLHIKRTLSHLSPGKVYFSFNCELRRTMVINIHAGRLLVNQSRTQEQLTFNDILPFLLKSIFLLFQSRLSMYISLS